MIDFDCDFLSLSKSKRSKYLWFLFLLCVFCLTWLRRGARGRRLPKSFSHCLQSSLRGNLRRAPDHGASVQRTSSPESSQPVFVFVCCKCVFESWSVSPDLFTVASRMNFGSWQVFFFLMGLPLRFACPWATWSTTPRHRRQVWKFNITKPPKWCAFRPHDRLQLEKSTLVMTVDEENLMLVWMQLLT